MTNNFNDLTLSPDILPEQTVHIVLTPVEPDDPVDTGTGYWIHKDTGVKTVFDMDTAWISGTTFNTPEWRALVLEIFVPEGITALGEYAFHSASVMTKLILQSTLLSVAIGSFVNCRRLMNLTINAISPPTIVDFGSSAGNSSTYIYVPADSVAAYKTAPVWSTYASIIMSI